MKSSRRMLLVLVVVALVAATAHLTSHLAESPVVRAAGPVPTFDVTNAGVGVADLETPTDLVEILLGDGATIAAGTEPLVNLATAATLAAIAPSPLPAFGSFTTGSADLGISEGLIIGANAAASGFRSNSNRFQPGVVANRTSGGPFADANALSAVATAAGLNSDVHNATSLTFELEPPAPGVGRYLKFEYSLLITEYGLWNALGAPGWSDEVFDFPDGFALFTGGTAVADNCATVPGTNTYLTMQTAGIVPPETDFAQGRNNAVARLAARVADLPTSSASPNGFAYSTGELVAGAFARNDDWAVQFLTVPLTCVYDAEAEIAAGDPIEVQIVIGDLGDFNIPPALVLKAASVRWSNSPTPQEEERLSVTRSGSGTGRITSTPAGIDCGTVCTANFGAGSTVTLTAAADPGSSFVGWSGACTGTGTCTVTMDQARAVDALFTSSSGVAPPAISPPGSPAPPAGPGFVPVDPVRVLDTRETGPVASGQTLQLSLRQSAPPSARGAVLTVTAVAPEPDSRSRSRGGYLSVFPCNESQPRVSSVNYGGGETIANAVITGIGQSGELCIFASQTTDVIVDVTGWFTEGFTPVTPERLLETRGPGGLPQPVAAGSVTRVRGTGVAGVPTSARGVVLNITAVNAAAAGYLSVYPCGTNPPNSSTLNFLAGDTAANLQVTAVDNAGDFCVLASAPTDLVIDVFGWFDQVFNPVVDTRVLDTRRTTAVAAGSTTRVRIAGVDSIPISARSTAVNITAVNPRAAGYLTVFPCGESQPGTSNSNFVTGRTIANSTYIGIGTNGELCIYSSAATDLLVDVFGWFSSLVVRN